MSAKCPVEARAKWSPPIPARPWRGGASCVGNVDARELAHLAIGSLHISGTPPGPTGNTYACGWATGQYVRPPSQNIYTL
jgi:hypothetical protein